MFVCLYVAPVHVFASLGVDFGLGKSLGILNVHEVRDRKSKRDKTLKVIKIPMKIRTDRNSCTFDIPSRKPVQNSQF